MNTMKLKDASGTITTGGASQVALAGGNVNQYFILHNPRTEVESLLLNFGSAAASGNAIELAPGGSYETTAGNCDSQSLNVFSATTGHKFVLKWA